MHTKKEESKQAPAMLVSARIEATKPPAQPIVLDADLRKCFGCFDDFCKYVRTLDHAKREELLHVVTKIPHHERREHEAKGVCLLALLCDKLSATTARQVITCCRPLVGALDPANADVRSQIHKALKKVDKDARTLPPENAIREASEYLWKILLGYQVSDSDMTAMWIVSSACDTSSPVTNKRPVKNMRPNTIASSSKQTKLSTPSPTPPSSPLPLRRRARAG